MGRSFEFEGHKAFAEERARRGGSARAGGASPAGSAPAWLPNGTGQQHRYYKERSPRAADMAAARAATEHEERVLARIDALEGGMGRLEASIEATTATFEEFATITVAQQHSIHDLLADAAPPPQLPASGPAEDVAAEGC